MIRDAGRNYYLQKCRYQRLSLQRRREYSLLTENVLNLAYEQAFEMNQKCML